MRLHTTTTMNIDTIMIMNILTCVVYKVCEQVSTIYILWVIPINPLPTNFYYCAMDRNDEIINSNLTGTRERLCATFSSAGKNKEASTGGKSYKQGWECITTD